jgi:hypothetical protein
MTPSDMRPTVVFLHIVKTAGTTLTGILQRQYDPRWTYVLPADRKRFLPLEWIVSQIQALPEDFLARLELITGHCPFGVHRAIPRPVKYVTFVRDPIDRATSLYYYVRRHPAHHLQPVARRLSLQEFVEQNIGGNLHNGQTAFIGGEGTSCDDVNPGVLGRAKRNIQDHFSVVGLTERFDESLVLMAMKLGWTKPVWYASQNRTRDRPARDQIDDETIEAIRRFNKLDDALYQFARQRFDAEIASLGESLDWKLRTLRMRCLGYSAATACVRRMPPPVRKRLSRLRKSRTR